MSNIGKFKIGTRFRVMGEVMEVIGIDGALAIIQNQKTGDIFSYGMKALERCLVTIIREGVGE